MASIRHLIWSNLRKKRKIYWIMVYKQLLNNEVMEEAGRPWASGKTQTEKLMLMDISGFLLLLSLLFIFSYCQLAFSKWQKTWATIAYKFYILHLIIRGRLFCHFLNVKFNNLRQYILLTWYGLISHPWNKSNVTWGRVIRLCVNISVP